MLDALRLGMFDRIQQPSLVCSGEICFIGLKLAETFIDDALIYRPMTLSDAASITWLKGYIVIISHVE